MNRKLRRAPRARDARAMVYRLWQSGGLVLLGALAAGMTAFPESTLSILKPLSGGVAHFWRTGLVGLGTFKNLGAGGVGALRSVAYRIRENDDLKRQVLALEQRAVLREEQQRELVRLRQMLMLKEDLGVSSFAAHVIGGDPSGLFSTLVLDAGSRDGVRDGTAVVAAGGAVGRVMSVEMDQSLALWLCDPRSRIAAYVQRSRVMGVLVGLGMGCELKYLAAGDDVKVGDRVLTAGRGSAFPKGVLLGIVKEVRKEGMLLAVEVLPAVKVRRLDEVLILGRAIPSP